MKDRKRYTAEQKVMILREFLENNTPISQLAEKYVVRPNDIYNWKKKLFESAANIFTPKVSTPKQTSAEFFKLSAEADCYGLPGKKTAG